MHGEQTRRAIAAQPEWLPQVPTDRRFPQVLLPTLSGEVHRVVVAIDTSGSIFGDKLRSFWTELVAILRNNRCEARVLTCATHVLTCTVQDTALPRIYVRDSPGTLLKN